MQLVCSKCGATCTLEEPARGKKARTFAGCASCGHLNRVPRGPKASRESDVSSEPQMAIAATAARALGGGAAKHKSTLLGVGARVSATDLLAHATPQAPAVALTPPPSRARISTPPVPDANDALADAMRAPSADDEDGERVDDAATEKMPDVAPTSERKPVAVLPQASGDDAAEEAEDSDAEEEDHATDVPAPASAPALAPAPVPAPASVRPAAPARRASVSAPSKIAASAVPEAAATSTAPRRGLVLPLLAIVASIAVVYVVTMRKDVSTKPESSEPAVSADGLLDQAEHALDEGDTKLASERVGQAEAIAKSPRALLERARIDAAIADTSWLHARLLAAPGAPPEAVPAANAARTSADAAMTAAPSDPAAARAKLDALRIAGDLEGARALVPRLAAIGEQSETAYVSAALELAEEGPLSLGAIARLRESVASGHQATRARSALAYALARTGDFAGARHEIDALASRSSGAPVIGELRAFVARADHGAKPAAPVVAAITSSVAVATPTPPATTVAPPVTPPVTAPVTSTKLSTSAPTAPTATGPVSMAAALEAQKSGDLARASTLFQALVAKSPNDIESLTALGDIARKEGRTRDAIGFYRRALTVNTSFFPALLGLADALWDSGERAAAQQRYTEITNRFSPGMYPTYVRQRIAADTGAP